MRKLAIFDIDGALIDSVKAHQEAFVYALQQCGLNSYNTDWSSYKHHTDRAIFESIFKDKREHAALRADLDTFETLIDNWLADHTSPQNITPLPGAKLFLKTIEQQYDIVFATGSLQKPAMRKLRHAGIVLPAGLIICCNDHCSREELLTAAITGAKHHYKTTAYEQVISFGDGSWGYQAAKNMDIPFVGIGNKALQQHGATLFSNFSAPGLYRLMNIPDPLAGCPDFELNAPLPVSQAFRSRGITTFREAAIFIKCLPYGRNADKTDLLTVLPEQRGTCSTKHALLKLLADEHNRPEVRLMTGLYKMTAQNTPGVANVLATHQLSYIPEAHNYLRYEHLIIDCTSTASASSDFYAQLIEETEIRPDQVGAYKVSYHQRYLDKWLKDNPDIGYTAGELWRIREQCIYSLSAPAGAAAT